MLKPLWAHLGSNQGPPDYESGALTDWAIGPQSGALNERQKYKKNKTIQEILYVLWKLILKSAMLAPINN